MGLMENQDTSTSLPPSPRAAASPYSLVIVDDEAPMRTGLLRWVHWERAGFSVIATYSDGSELLSSLETMVPDAVLTDIRMTFVSGLDVARHIHEKNLDIQVVLLSAYQDFEYARTALRYGVVDYILKPVSARDVERVFGRVARRIEARRRAQPAEGSEGLLPDAVHNPAPPADEHVGDGPGGSGGSLGQCPPEGKAGDTHEPRRVIVAAKKHIDAHLSDDISLDSVACAVGLSPEYLSRLFKQEMGTNYVDYLIARRIDQAKTLLRDPTLRVYEVSSAVGYRNQKYFARLFRSVTGLTPTEYRERSE